MTHIPVEVLNEIFIKLDLKDKLECMLVSRLWYNALDQYHLLDTLDISDRVFFKLKEIIERQPHRATQVEYLKMEPNTSLAFDKRIICNMFPNLQEAISKLEKIEDFGECELTRQLAISNMCSKLTLLEIDFVNLNESARSLIHDLQNMPVLEELKLCNLKVGLMDLEIIHDNLPSIELLDLEDLNLTSGETPRNVMPAALVTNMNLFLERVYNLNTHLQFYKYMVKKYPSLHVPNFNDRAIKFQGRQYTFGAYHEGLFFFYQNVGYKAERVTFANYYSGLDVFSRFDTLGMKIAKLRLEANKDEDEVLFIEQLVQSQQHKYLQGLYLTDIIPQPIHMLSKMKALTSLEIECYRFNGPKTIDFNQLLEACPATLKAVHVESADLRFDESTIPVTSIHNLKLVRVELTPALVKTIETSFPVLSTLELWCNMTRHRTISLPNHHLQEATLTIEEIGQRGGFSIKTQSNEKPSYFTRGEIPHSSENKRTESMAVSEEEFDDPLMMNFICASVEELFLYTAKFSLF